MGFPTVKSDPWKRNRPRKPARGLWPDRFWRDIASLSAERRMAGWTQPGIHEEVIALIGDINERMYGKR